MGLFDGIKKFVKNIFGAIGDVIGYVLGVDTGIDDQYKGQLVNKQSNTQKIPVIYGERLVGGTRVFVSTGGGKKNQYLYIALVLSEGEVESIGNVYINDVLSTDSKFSNKVTIYKYKGSDTQTATTLFNDANDPWTSAHQLKGVAYLAMRFKYDQDVFSGVPEVRAVVKGRKVYNPDTGITEWSDNPALCLRDYLTNTRYGKGLPTSAIDDASFIQAASDCNTFVTPYNGGTDIPLFKFNAIVDTGETVFNNVKKILASMRGIMPYSNGQYSLLIDKDQNSTFTLTENNILSEIKVVSSSKENKFNQVIAKFPNPAKRWELDTVIFPESGSADETQFLSEDNQQVLSKEITLHNVTNAYRAKDLARIACLASRNQSLTVNVTCTSEALNVAIGDIITLEHDSLGWTGAATQEFRVMGMVLSENGEVDFTLQQYDSSIYPWVEQSEQTDGPETTLPDPFTAQPVTTPTSTGNAVVHDDGTVAYFYDLEWAEPDDALIEYYTIDVNKVSNGVTTTAAETLQTQNLNYRYMVSDTSIDYGFTIKAVNGTGTRSVGVTIDPIPVVGDTTPPAAIAALSASVTAGLQTITLSWANPSDEDFDLVRIKVNDTNSEPEEYFASVRSDTFVHDIGEYSTEKHYWASPVDTSGNAAAYTYLGSATTGSIDYADVGNTPTIPEVATTAYLTLGDNNAPTDVEFNTAVGRDPIENDFVVVNKEFAFNYNGTAWVAVTEFIDGSLLVSGSISADDITTGTLNANDVTISNLTVSYDTQVTGTPDLSEFITGGEVNENVTSISGGVIQTGTAVTVGTGDDVAVISGADDTYRIWAGNVDPDTLINPANFKVHKDGTLYATNAVISGDITAGSINADNITFTGTLTADNLAGIPNVEALNMTQSMRNEIEEIIVTKFGSDASTGYYDEATGSFDAQDDDTEVCKILAFQHNGSNIDIDLTFSKSWQASSGDIPSVEVKIQRAPAGTTTWTTIKTQTVTGSTFEEPELNTWFANIQGYVSATDNPATGNYDYRFLTGNVLNLSLISLSAKLEANETGEQIGTIDLADYARIDQDETIIGNYTFSGTTSGIDYGDLDNTPDLSTKANLSGATFTGKVEFNDEVIGALKVNDELANTDLDSLTSQESGIYWSNDQYGTNTNVPYANYFTMLHIRNPYSGLDSASNALDRSAQLWFGDTPAGGIRWRAYQGSTTGWHDWEKIYTDNDFDSTDISNWNTAFGWGDHSSAGYLTEVPSPITKDLVIGGSVQTSWGRPKIGNYDIGWGAHPSVGSDGGSAGQLIMLANPHIPYRTDNERTGASGRAGIRCGINATQSSWWDIGLTGDQFEIYRSASETQLMTLNNSGDVGFAGGLSLNGSSTIDSSRNAFLSRVNLNGLQNTVHNSEKVFQTPYYTHNTANLAFDVRLGNDYINGFLEFEITGGYSQQNATGCIKRRWFLGFNPDNSIWQPPITIDQVAVGNIVGQIYVSDPFWDSTNSTYAIRVYHTVSTGNRFTCRIKLHGDNVGYRLLDNFSTSGLFTESTSLSNTSSINYWSNIVLGNAVVYSNGELATGSNTTIGQRTTGSTFTPNSTGVTESKIAEFRNSSGSNGGVVAFHQEGVYTRWFGCNESGNFKFFSPPAENGTRIGVNVNPETEIHVVRSTNNANVRIQGDGGSYGYTDFFHGDTETGLYSSSTQPINFYNDGNKKLTIDTNLTTLKQATSFEDYVDISGIIYNRDNMRVLNSAGNGWNTWFERNSGSPNLTVNNIVANAIEGNSGATLRTNGLRMERAYTNNAIWFNGGTDLNHVLWNSYYGETPTTRGGAGSGFDGMMWRTYRGLRIKGGLYGAYDCLKIENSGGSNNDHYVRLYQANGEKFRTTSYGTLHQRDIAISGGLTSSAGNRLIVGATDTAFTAQDANQRPTIQANGKYPVLSLNHTVTSNTNHGPTVQYTCNGVNGYQWVHGTSGNGEDFFVGFSSTALGNNIYNPHAGIAGYNGTSYMQMTHTGKIGLGAQGDWGGTGGGDPAFDLTFKGALHATGGHASVFQNLQNAGVNGSGFYFSNVYGNHSWGMVAEYRVEATSGDSPSILFSKGGTTNTWSVGYGYNDTGTFRIKRDHGHRNAEWGTTLMSMDRSGNVTFSGNVTSYSDKRLKTNIKTIENPIDIISKIRGVSFDWKETGERAIGVIAQEIEAVPELSCLVSETAEDGTSEFRQKNVAYGNMVGLLIEAIKELKQEIEELKNGNN